MRTARLSLPSLVLAILATPVLGQYRDAVRQIENLKRLQGDISPDKERSASKTTATAVKEAANKLKDSLSDCGKELADLSGKFSDERRLVRRAAQDLKNQAEVTGQAAYAWESKLEKEDAKAECEIVKKQVAETLNLAQAFDAAIVKTRSWLVTNTRDTKSSRETMSREANPLEKAEDATCAKMEQALKNHSNAVQDMIRAADKHRSAEARESDAQQRWNATMTSEATPQQEQDLTSKWIEATLQLKEAASLYADAMKAAAEKAQELRNAMTEYASAFKDLEAYEKDLTNRLSGSGQNDFKSWLERFEKEFAR